MRMALLLIVGTDTALIEGTSQTLTAAGHQLLFSSTLADALDSVGDARPIVVLVEQSAIDEIRMTLRVPLAEGGAFLVFHGEDAPVTPMPARVQRATLAELELPLEAKRLLALVRYVETRAQIVGRESASDWESTGDADNDSDVEADIGAH
jgi:DNA-binding NtrC family response regulator